MTVPIFPDLPGVSWPAVVTPLWASLRPRSVSGRAAFQPLWSAPLRRYTLTYDVLQSDDVGRDFEALEGFYNLVMSRPGGLFRFDDRDDRAATDQPFGIGDGAVTRFQLVTRRGGFVYPVQCVLSVSAIIVGGDVTTAYTVDALGVVTFATAPAAGAALTWTGEYAWYCNFDDDSLDFEQFAQGFWGLGEIKFTTVKL